MFQKVFLRTTRARRFRSGMIILCAIVAIVLVAVGASPLLANPGTVTIRVDPATRAAPVNGTFTVDIVADVGTEMNPNGLGAYEFDLVGDPNYLEVLSADDAEELGATGRTVTELGPNITTTTVTTMTFAAYSHPPLDVSGPVSSTVVLATVTLRAKRAGVTTLNLENALLTNTQANAWPDPSAGRDLSMESGVLILDTYGDEIGVRRGGTWYLDYDGDWSWNGSIDVKSSFGLATDTPLTGDWNGDGGDEIGVRRGGTWYLDYDGDWGWNGSIDVKSSFGLATDTPLVGDWNGDVRNEIGVRRGGTWYLDYDGDWSWNGSIDVRSSFGLATDTPLVGDWNGDGTDEIGVWRGGTWYLDYDGDWSWNGSIDVRSSFGLATDTPLVGDWNGDGRDEIGVRRGGTWYLDYDGNWGWNGSIDVRSSFGLVTDTPLTGDWNGTTP